MFFTFLCCNIVFETALVILIARKRFNCFSLTFPESKTNSIKNKRKIVMKRILIKNLVGLMMIGAFAIFSFAQTKERVQLKVDSTDNDIALQRTLAPNGSLTVTFRAKAGQTISYTAGYDFKDSDLEVFFTKSGGNDFLKESGPKATIEYLIPETGDYDILIENRTNKRVTMTLYLNLFSAEFMAAANSSVESEALDFTGSDQANVSKTIPANGTMKFTFNGAKGATAIVKVTDRTNKLTVIFNDNPNQKADTTIALNKEISRKINRTGEYTIEVVNETAKSISFGLEVIIDMSASNSTNTVSSGEERIEFARGATSASVTREISAYGEINFVFNVKKGQKVTYTVDYDDNESDLSVYLGEPGDQDASITSSAKKPKTFMVKKSGDHRLDITNTTKRKVLITVFLDVE